MTKYKIAFIKFGGLSAGGTEKFLQNIAANLPEERFDVDYFYCDAAPYVGSNYKHATTDPGRLKYMREHSVNLIKFTVGAKDITRSTHDWIDTDFWDYFREEDYDMVQTGRAGHPEYPFCKIEKIPIIDSIHFLAGVDNQYNIARVMHICEWSARRWIEMGGDRSRVVIVSHPLDLPGKKFENLRKSLQLENRFIFGFHQRNDDDIFSEIPLNCHKRIENGNNAFLLLGGGDKYRAQADDLGLKNVYFLPHTSNADTVYSFLSTLDVYSHGRKDGEVNSTAMAEAMFFGLPIVSHLSPIHNGHVECIGEAGKVAKNEEEYVQEMIELQRDKDYYKYRSSQAKQRFSDKYELKKQIENVVEIYNDVYRNPFPNSLRRILLASSNSSSLTVITKLCSMIDRLFGLIVRKPRKKYPLLEADKESYRRHHSQYLEPNKLGIERWIHRKYDNEDQLNEPAIKLGKLLNEHPDKRDLVVDIGSGTGWLCARLSNRFRKVIAIEPSKAAIDIAKKLYPKSKYPNVEWYADFAEERLAKIEPKKPSLFVSLVVISHLPDNSVTKICSIIDIIAPKGSILCFSECFGKQSREHMWHTRTKAWWQKNLPSWKLDFHGPNIQNNPVRYKGFHGIKVR